MGGEGFIPGVLETRDVENGNEPYGDSTVSNLRISGFLGSVFFYFLSTLVSFLIISLFCGFLSFLYSPLASTLFSLFLFLVLLGQHLLQIGLQLGALLELYRRVTASVS